MAEHQGNPEAVKKLAGELVIDCAGYQPREILVALQLVTAEMVRSLAKPEDAQQVLATVLAGIAKAFNQDYPDARG